MNHHACVSHGPGSRAQVPEGTGLSPPRIQTRASHQVKGAPAPLQVRRDGVSTQPGLGGRTHHSSAGHLPSHHHKGGKAKRGGLLCQKVNPKLNDPVILWAEAQGKSHSSSTEAASPSWRGHLSSKHLHPPKTHSESSSLLSFPWDHKPRVSSSFGANTQSLPISGGSWSLSS